MARYTSEEKLKYYWAETLTNPAAPKVAEVTAATVLCGMSAYPSLELKGSSVPTPDLCSTFTSSIVGTDSVADTMMEFYADDDPTSAAATVQGLLGKGVAGYLITAEPKDGVAQPIAAGMVVNVWPVTIQANSYVAPAANAARKFVIAIVITAKPSTAVAVVT